MLAITSIGHKYICCVTVGNLRLLVSLEVLVASKRLVAARVVALAHGAAHDINVDGAVLGLAGALPGRSDLGPLQLGGLALDLVHHHLPVRTHAAGRRRAVHREAAHRRL